MDSPRDLFGIFLRGLCMGAADAVPGVSGGTIALITGIYERLIAAITAITPARIGRIARGIRSDGRADAIDALDELDAEFLLALVAGIATAVVTVLSVVSYLLEAYPVSTFGFFFGLIAASAIVLFRPLRLDTRGRIGAAMVGFLAAFVVSGHAANSLGSGPVIVFVAGAIAVSAMLLPGISGSLLLVLLGQYAYMSDALSTFVRSIVGVVTGDGTAAAIEAAPPVLTFMGGAVVGLFTVAYGVRFALKRYRAATVAFLVSLIVGALRAPVEQVSVRLQEVGQTWTPAVVAAFVGFAIAGAVAVLVLDRYAGAIEYART
ncbi:MAG: DUF368 domain-containing protein [Halobacteriota archaeon]